MIPLKALWKIGVAARKQEASSAIAMVRLGGWVGPRYGFMAAWLSLKEFFYK